MLSLAALSSAVAFSLWSLQGARRDAALARQELDRLLASGPQQPAQTAPAKLAPDFAAALGPLPPAHEVIQVVYQSAQRFGATVGAVRVAEQAPTDERLARMELSFELRAPYASLKAALADVLKRVPATTLARLNLQADPSTNVVVGQITLRVWGAPLPAPEPGNARKP